MDHALSRLLTTSTLVVLGGVLSVAACTHGNERVVEPVGGADASTNSPEVGDASVAPIGPIAPMPRAHEPDDDFRLVRAPEFGGARDAIAPHLQLVSTHERQGGLGGVNAGGSAGFGGSDLRPVVACGGSTYY